MDTLIFEESSFEQDGLKVYSGLASPYNKAGDSLLNYFSPKLSTICVLDGVSSSASPSESSALCKKTLKNFFKSKRTFKIDDYKELLKGLNKEMLDKCYSSTLSQIVFTEDALTVFTVGDSQVFLFDERESPVYESWPQNLGFSNSKDNPTANVILNWIGNDHLRFEIAEFDKKVVKSGLIISDGVLDFLEVKKMPLSEIKAALLKNFKESSSKNLLDDSSFIYFEFST